MKMFFNRWAAVGGLLLVFTANGYAQSGFTVPPGGTSNLPSGSSMNLACAALTVQGALNMNSAQVDSANAVTIAASGAVDAGQSTITLSGDWSNNGTFAAGTSTVVFNNGCTAGPMQLSGNTVFYNLTLSSTSGSTFVIPAGSNITVNGTLTLQGTNGQPITLVSSSGSPAVINLGPNAHVNQVNTNLNNVQIGAGTNSQGIPTLQTWGLLMLGLLLTALMVWQQRREHS
ncbi:IPTL-CTERM sorting domain-containing protein [Curvibacter lanceolatus]|uniref:IPTL-CTERM sorting domain-containing protein n=1 Tax=Curvibacter lanceolatus TaxID=86182 RepID=UPI00146A138F|nr:IPTL-CTERM sorting domain-containing protein [Curvibacter lanceolatus]